MCFLVSFRPILRPFMAHIVRAWLVTPPAALSHPKTALLRKASQRPLAVRARKVGSDGTMRVVTRGLSEDLATFAADLHHLTKDKGWAHQELVASREDEGSVSGGQQKITPTDPALAGGPDSSGGAAAAAGGAGSAADSIPDSGSNASSRIIRDEVRLERVRGEAAVAAAEARVVAESRATAAESEARAAAEARAAEAEAEARAVAEAAINVLINRAGMTREEAEEAVLPKLRRERMGGTGGSAHA